MKKITISLGFEELMANSLHFSVEFPRSVLIITATTIKKKPGRSQEKGQYVFFL